MNTNERNELYPVFFKLHQLHMLIVGGGYVGYEKLFFILKSSPRAQITLVSPEIIEPVRKLLEEFPQVEWIPRIFLPEDVKDKDLIIAATNDNPTNIAIRKIARQSNILINVADTPELCDFYLGSIVTKGPLKVAISTNGKSPTFAKRFRQLLEDTLPETLPELLTNLRQIRDRLKGDFESKVNRLNELTADLLSKN